MQWFRMYHEFATDPKVQMLSEADQRRYIMVLCLKACNGDVTLQCNEVAFQLRISNDEWSATKATLLAKGLITEDNQPTNWDKRQYASDTSAERVARYRSKVKRPCNVTVTAPDTDTDTDTDTEAEEKQSREEVEEERKKEGSFGDKSQSDEVGSAPSKYAFEGQVMKITRADLRRWEDKYPCINVIEHLKGIEKTYAARIGTPDEIKNVGWFFSVQSSLHKANAENKSKRPEGEAWI